jgi:tetratricopeptide (TPR) repeat protein
MYQYHAIGGGILRTTGFAILADGHHRLGRFEEALALVEEGLANVAASQEHHYEQELYRIKGDALFGLGRPIEAEEAIRHALDLSRAQGARSLELRAAVSLARLKRDTSERIASRDLLAGIYDRFTEGFGTRDLKEAKALLDVLAETREG